MSFSAVSRKSSTSLKGTLVLGCPFKVVPRLYSPALIGCPLPWEKGITSVSFNLVNLGRGLTTEGDGSTPRIWEMSFILKGYQGGTSQMC